jgi:hypothetical protein
MINVSLQSRLLLPDNKQVRFASTHASSSTTLTAPRTAFQFHPYHLVDPSP